MLTARFCLISILLMLLVACGSGSPTATVPAAPTPAPTLAPTVTATTAPTATPVPPTATPPSTATATRAPTASATRPPANTPSAPASGFNPETTTIQLEPFVEGLRAPTHLANANDGTGRLFVVEKAGTIRIVDNGQLREMPFLDISSVVNASASERGLLGLAFHPKYKSTGQFFVYYTDARGDLIIARYKVSSDPNAADVNSGQELLHIEHREAPNHNGGQLAFGPDGYLYIGTGDGGGAGDRFGNSQNPGTLLAKVLRIDVNSGSPYGIPKNNPFVNRAGFRPEIWAWGLRNPWRFSFDRATGDLYIADVGQNAWEEVNFQPANSKGGENYGWNKMEGTHCYPASAECERNGFVLPVGEYAHGRGDCSITGGFVYRGKAQPALVGAYFAADYCTGRFWSLQRVGGQWQLSELVTTRVLVSSFGEDEQGELYVLGLSDGVVYKLTAAPK